MFTICIYLSHDECPNNIFYYSLKIFPCFWLVKTTHIIHHNQLLFTKFENNLCHIEPMMSKVQPTEKTWGRDCVIFGEQKNKEWNGKSPLRMGKHFEWIIMQLLKSAFIGFEEFCRFRRVLSTSAFSLCG